MKDVLLAKSTGEQIDYIIKYNGIKTTSSNFIDAINRINEIYKENNGNIRIKHTSLSSLELRVIARYLKLEHHGILQA